MSADSQGRHRRHANPFSLRRPQAPVLPPAFARRAPWAVDVGCGGGAFTVELARAHPGYNVLGVDLRAHLVERTQERMRTGGLAHGWALVANASCHLDALVPPGSIAQLMVNFPDPWYKQRHHKRRVVSAGWLAHLEPLLMPGALIHLACDLQALAKDMRRVLDAATPTWAPAFGCRPWARTSTTGLLSERERTHLGRGEHIWRLCYRYVGPGGQTMASAEALGPPPKGVVFDLPAGLAPDYTKGGR